jgi:hypothetical protein
MRIIKTPSYIETKEALVDLNTHPGFNPTKNDDTPSKNIFEKEKDSRLEIEKRWKDKKKKNKGGIVYQWGIPVPLASEPKE